MIKFLDPRGSVATEIEAYDLSCDLGKVENSGLKIALLANGFPDSVLFLEKIRMALSRKLPKLRTQMWHKGNAGVAASREMLDEIEADCHAAITAYGH